MLTLSCEDVFVQLFLGSSLTQVIFFFFLLFAFVVFELCTYWSMQRFPLQGNILLPLSTGIFLFTGNLPSQFFFFFPTSLVSVTQYHNNVTGSLSCSWLSKKCMKKRVGKKGNLKVPFAAVWCWQHLGYIEICLFAYCSEERI